jgi:hypothetical protein
MSYSKFKKLEQLSKELGISYKNIAFLPYLTKQEVSRKILEDLADANITALTTEKAKSENIVSPVLKDFVRSNIEIISSFSGFEFNVDAQQKLTGYCDFILSASGRKLEITAPIFCLVEAKNAEIDKGLAQCGAEMYAGLLFNEKNGIPRKVMYGCVTNAFSWCFLKLEGKELLIDPNYVPLSFARPHEVLAVLQWILDKSLANAPSS